MAHKFPGLPEYPCTRPSWIPSAFAHSASAPRHWAGALPKASSNNCLGPPGLLGHRTGQWEPTDTGRPSPSHLVSPLSPLQGSLTLLEGLTRQRWRDRDFCPPGQLASSSHVLNLQSPGHTQKGEAGRLECPGVCPEVLVKASLPLCGWVPSLPPLRAAAEFQETRSAKHSVRTTHSGLTGKATWNAAGLLRERSSVEEAVCWLPYHPLSPSFPSTVISTGWKPTPQPASGRG